MMGVGAEPAAPNPWRRNFAVVWASNFITSAGMMAFIPLVPFYTAEMGITDPAAVRAWSGLLVAAAPLPAALLGPLWGALGDRIGRKLMMVRANLAIVVFVGLMSLVASPWQMLALRLLQGVFSGYIAPAMTLVSVSTPADLQGRAAAQLQTAAIAGSILGPLLGGVVADVLGGYRPVFVLTAALALLSLVLIVWLVREPEGRLPASGPLRPVELVQGMLREVVAFVGHPALRTVLLAAFTVRFGAALVEPVLALYVEGLAGTTPELLSTITGAVFGSQAVATLLFTTAWGGFGDRRGARRLLTICSGGAALFYLAQGLVDHVVPLLLLRFGSGVFLAGVIPAAFTAAARHSEPGRRGGAYGVTFSSVVLAQALAPVAGGFLAAGVGLRPLFVVAAVLMAAAAWLHAGRLFAPSDGSEAGAREKDGG